jgi:hypothetical protein
MIVAEPHFFCKYQSTVKKTKGVEKNLEAQGRRKQKKKP